MSSRYGLQIRAANSGDAAGIAELMQSAGLAANASALAARLDAFSHDSGVVLLAVEWGPPTGIVVVSWLQDLSEEGRIAQIGLLLVHPDGRRRGIGRMLLKAASQASRVAGCSTLRILDRERDGSLAALCLATGFEAEATLYKRPLRKKPRA